MKQRGKDNKVKAGFFEAKSIVIIVIAVVLLIASLLLGLGTALGWYRRTEEEKAPVDAGTFSVQTIAWFDDGTAAPVSPSDSRALDIKQLVAVDIRDAQAANYVGKLRVSSLVTSSIMFSLRVTVANLWIQGDSVPRLNPVPLVSTANIIDNSRRDTGYYYCDTANYTTQDYNDGDFSDFHLPPCTAVRYDVITGLDETQMADYDSDVLLSLKIQSELVQANRVSQVWQSLPAPKI